MEEQKNGQWTKVVQVTEADWIALQEALAELKSCTRDLELRLKSVDSSVQLLLCDAGY